MARPLYQMDVQHRYTPVGAMEPYYWCNWWHWDSGFLDPFSDPAYNAILLATFAGTLETVQHVAYRVRDIANGTDHGIVTPSAAYGLLPDDGGGSLINTVRLAGYKGGKQVCYKRWRVPLRSSDSDGVRVSSDLLSVFTGTVVPYLLSGTICNARRVIVDEWRVEPYIAGWQLRRGTKRRMGPVFPY